jgi:hypothetical protein
MGWQGQGWTVRSSGAISLQEHLQGFRGERRDKETVVLGQSGLQWGSLQVSITLSVRLVRTSQLDRSVARCTARCAARCAHGGQRNASACAARTVYNALLLFNGYAVLCALVETHSLPPAM